MRKIVFIVFLIFPLLLIYPFKNMPTEGSVEFPVRRGEDFRTTMRRLKREEIIRDTFRFLMLARILRLDKKTKYGFYTFKRNLPEIKVLFKLAVKGAPLIEFTIRIPEGYTLKKMAPLFKKIGIEPDTFLKYTTDSSFINKVKRCCLLIDSPQTLEGYLYPDTYKFVYGESVYDVVCKMLRKTCSIFDSSVIKRMHDIDFSVHEVLTLASIIEKEAMVDSERYIISGVFHNRLRKGIPLASNPTLNYALGKNYGWLPRWAIRSQTPYNTYIYPGLPPGPICAPSRKSILAALWPKKVRFLYFVAKGDGTHLFAKTYAQHRKNIRYVKYLMFRKRNSKSSSSIVKNVEKVDNKSKTEKDKTRVKDSTGYNINQKSNNNSHKSN